MSGRLTGKVAFITGAARGQGRAHAVRMAAEGADIIAVDVAGKLPSCVPYESATPEDLAETVRLVEHTGSRIFLSVTDIRDFDELRQVADDGVAVLTPFLPNYLTEPDDIADAVLRLASDQSRNVTAARIAVDQGSTQY